MKKRNSRKKVKSITSRKSENKSTINKLTIPMIGNFVEFCEKIVQHSEDTGKLSPDYFFCKAIKAREEKSFQIERQSILNLLFFLETPNSSLIEKILTNRTNFVYSEKIISIMSLIEENTSSDVYLHIIKSFILSGTKQQIAPYFNCFMGISQNINKESPFFDFTLLPEKTLLFFYEETHRLLLDNSNNIKILEKITLFIYNIVKNSASQSLLFFVSYFNTRSNPDYAIEIANMFLDAPNLATDKTSYLQTLANNTAWTAINISDIYEAHFWLEYIENNEKSEKIKKAIDSLEEKISSRSNHPLNPENISPQSIDEITTKDIIALCSFIDGCGDDWGLKRLSDSGKYIFPSKYITTEMFKTLAVNGFVKMSQASFNELEDEQLTNFNDIIFKAKFHVNIIGVGDSKQLAMPILLEELERRSDKFEAFYVIYNIISTGYFYNAFEYYLNNITESWARGFTLNEKTIERIFTSKLSAKDLSYIARHAIGYAAGQHSIGSTNGNKHTCNILIGSINRNFDWVDTGKFYPKTFPRDKKQPVLSSERILEKIFGITPDDLYNLPPKSQELNQNEILEDEF
ncbi:hypothetical protein ID850_10865 [Xenorhabdus sp. Flor]|uniref:hypothetical protein n=1 Tax=Xenorhabdus cabanillasii TaxID=351673 RepID=UPI0019828235|nr:hypothetical protein [Xenorhabdus sp. Flor]MBD2815260.1 hypothetical protein [Xenorhabdus sp. Flor]